jgi:hypothetical protein
MCRMLKLNLNCVIEPGPIKCDGTIDKNRTAHLILPQWKGSAINVGSEVITEVVMKSSTYWNITPCSPLKVNQRFGRTYRTPSVSKNKPCKVPARIQMTRRDRLCLAPVFTLSSCSIYFSTLKEEAICPSETSLTFSGLHSITCKNIVLISLITIPRSTTNNVFNPKYRLAHLSLLMNQYRGMK